MACRRFERGAGSFFVYELHIKISAIFGTGRDGSQGPRRGQNKVARRVPRGFLGLEKLSPHSGDQISALGLGAPRGEENALKTAVKTLHFRVFNPCI